MLLVASAMFGMFFFASLYVQEILGYSPLKAGLAFLPVTVGIVVGAGIAQRLISRFGVRAVAVVGLALATAGMADPDRPPRARQLLADLLVGLIPLSHRHGPGVRADHAARHVAASRNADAGLASGCSTRAQQVGGSLGLALMSTLAASRTTALLH